MIHISRQLKDLVRNMAKSNSTKAQIIIRNYMMERFLERLSLSKYRDNFILKGGVLISAMVGLDMRATMDIDTTIKNLPLTVADIEHITKEVSAVPIDDGVTFEIKSVISIMDEADYGGIRVMMEGKLDTMKTPLKIDISTGDVITPKEVSYQLRTMFDNRPITVWAYNLETVLAEKLETVITRGVANTRMRDFYDLYILGETLSNAFDINDLKLAFEATCKSRESEHLLKDAELILSEIGENDVMKKQWIGYQNKFDYAGDIAWNEVVGAIKGLVNEVMGEE